MNPWSCNFIPLTKCTHPTYRDSHSGGVYKQPIPKSDNKVQSKFDTFLTKLRNDMLVEKYQDMSSVTDSNYWLYLRLLAFVQRPNIQTRWIIRESMTNVKQIHSSSKRSYNKKSLSSKSNTNRTLTRNNNNKLNKQNLPRNWNHRIAVMSPCVGLHIRHSDRSAGYLVEKFNDYSTKHFGLLAKNLSQSLGINSVFLTTDNATVRDEAAELYPSLNWFAQIRTIAEYVPGTFYSHFNHKSRKRDLSDLLTDLIVISRCTGFTGSKESGFGKLLQQYQCIRNKLGDCPPVLLRGELGELTGSVNYFTPVVKS